MQRKILLGAAAAVLLVAADAALAQDAPAEAPAPAPVVAPEVVAPAPEASAADAPAPAAAVVAPAPAPVDTSAPSPASSTSIELHGYARMPLAFQTTPREPYLIDGDYYLSGFAYTRLNEPDWAELFLSAKYQDYRAKFGIFTSLYSDYATTELESQAGIAQASVEARRFLGAEALTVELGVFWDRFGHIDPYDTYIFGRTHQGGFKARYDFSERAHVQVGAGVHQAVRQQNQGMTPVAHLTGGIPLGAGVLGGYLVYTWTKDKPKLSPIEDGSLMVLGVDLRYPIGSLGPLYVAASHYRAEKALFLAPAVELLHSSGGRGLTENFLGLTESDSGTGTFWVGALDFPAQITREIGLRFFGMTTYVNSGQASEMPLVNKDDRLYVKWGVEPGYRIRPGLVVSMRYDRVILDMNDQENGFRALSPRVRFPLADWGELMLQYSHYFYGDKVQLRSGQVPLEDEPDTNAFKVQASAVW